MVSGEVGYMTQAERGLPVAVLKISDKGRAKVLAGTTDDAM